MTQATLETTVGAWVRALPARARIFENLGIDYCCGGKKPLAEICRQKGLDAQTVVAMLNAIDGSLDPTVVDVNHFSLSELCNHIERNHHDWLREELPRLDFMTQKVAMVHGREEPRLVKIRAIFEAFAAEIQSHTEEEEGTVFPLIRALEGKDPGSEGHLLREFLGKLESEHERAGAALEAFAQLSDHYSPPEWACNTFRALYDTLQRLEHNMHQHVHKENNILFPSALAMAEAR